MLGTKLAHRLPLVAATDGNVRGGSLPCRQIMENAIDNMTGYRQKEDDLMLQDRLKEKNMSAYRKRGD